MAYAARVTPAVARSGCWQLPAGGLAAGRRRRAAPSRTCVWTGARRSTLAAGQVRVAVPAVGVNFRDVMVALGMYPGGGELGVEGAGVVVEVGPGVTGLAVGDAVMGLLGSGGRRAVVDARLVTAVPAGWSLCRPPACRWFS